MWTFLWSRSSSSSSPSSISSRCLSFSSSTECWSFLLCHRVWYAQCKLCRRLEIPQRSFSKFLTCPSLCNDRPRWSRQFRLEVPQIQFIAGFGGHPSWQQRQVSQLGAMKAVFRPFRPFFALLRVVPELIASCSHHRGLGGGADAGRFSQVSGHYSCQLILSVCGQTHPSERSLHNNNNNNNTIWRGSVLTGEEPPPHSGELKHALPQAGGPTQSQLSRPVSSGHHISMEHRLRRKQ